VQRHGVRIEPPGRDRGGGGRRHRRPPLLGSSPGRETLEPPAQRERAREPRATSAFEAGVPFGEPLAGAPPAYGRLSRPSRGRVCRNTRPMRGRQPGQDSPPLSRASERAGRQLLRTCPGRRAGLQVTTSALRRMERSAGARADGRLAVAWTRHRSARRADRSLAGGARGPKGYGPRASASLLVDGFGTVAAALSAVGLHHG
jgi:hypothetical protein